MTTTANSHKLGANGPQWFNEGTCKLEDFSALVSQETRLEDYAYADAVEQNVLIYGNRLRDFIEAPTCCSCPPCISPIRAAPSTPCAVPAG